MTEAAADPGGISLALAGGGTGGHLFPGLAVAELALASGLARDVVFFGAERGIESRLVPASGYELVAEPVTGLVGGGPRAIVSSLARLARAVVNTRGELRRRGVDVLVGLGGYASAPAVIAALLARVPVVLLEQNREPGLSNRVLARLARAVCTSFEESARHFPSGRSHFTGNPIRPALERGGDDARRDTLLVFGGSAGALSLNRAVSAALARLADEPGAAILPRIVHQSGARGLDEVRAAYERTCTAHPGLDVEVVEFIDDMAAAYGRAMLAVCRSGATSIAELIATATPSVLLPYPHAAGDHQSANARALEGAGAAVVVRDDDDAADRLVEVLGRLLRSRDQLDSISSKVAVLRRPGATERVLDVVRAVLARQ